MVLFVVILNQACLEPVPSNEGTTEPFALPEMPSVSPANLEVEIILDEPGRSTDQPVGPLRAFIQQKETSLSMDVELASLVSSWPASFTVPDVPDGPLRVTIYEDENADGQFSGCPFPRLPHHTELLGVRDRLAVTVDRPDRTEAIPLAATLRHTICGPGFVETGVSGTIEFPPNEGDDASTVYLYITPVSTAEQSDIIQPLRIPLFPSDSVETSRGFSIGELLPGRYTITAFTDNDGDHTPTPCGNGLGGGDRYVVTIEGVEVIAGQRRLINTPLTLRSSDCPDEPTGLKGQLSMNSSLLGEARQLWRAQWGLLDGAVYIRLVRYGTHRSEQSWQLLPSIVNRPLPQSFTVTGAEPGLYRIEIFLDRDGDGRFVPCDGVPRGFDSIYSIRESLRLEAGEIIDIGELELRNANCIEEAVTGLVGQVRVPIEAGSSGSGRSVRMELYPLDTSGERLSFKMFDNHWKLASDGAPFTQEVPQGAYRGQVYLDTDADGDFSECTVAPFADRASAPPFVVDLAPGSLVDIGLQQIELLGCPVISTELTLSLDADDGLNPIESRSLRVAMSEVGGWTSDVPLVVAFDGGRLRSEELRLATGSYAFIVYVDEDEDGVFTPCNDGLGDRVSSSFNLQLDNSETNRVIELQLSNQCP